MSGHMKNLMVALTLLVVAMLLAACAGNTQNDGLPTPAATEAMENMETEAAEAMEGMETEAAEGMEMGDTPSVPAGLAYAEGEEIRFIHTEVSDAGVADLLSKMMDSPVLLVPSLADAPESMLADVYVFTNGPVGMGPLGFQPDVFGDLPGSEGYTPLRSIVLATWTDESKARELKSVAEVLEAEANGELAFERPGVVVNMPFIVWPGGSR